LIAYSSLKASGPSMVPNVLINPYFNTRKYLAAPGTKSAKKYTG